MRQRFKGVWSIVGVAVIALVCAPAARAAEEKAKTKEKKEAKPVVAVFTLDGPITEKPAEEDLFFASERSQSLKDLVERMKKARDDKNVKAVVLLIDEAIPDLAQTEELRQAMDALKSAGKDVYAHVDALMMTRTYALVSGASKISVTPTAIIMITGFYSESPYLRGLLDKIGVTPDYLTCGEYKSAAELFMRKGPSPAAERMKNWLLDSMYETCLNLIAKGRGVKVEQARLWIDGAVYTPEKAKDLGMIDDIQHRQDFSAMLKAKYGEDVKFDRKYGKKRQGPDIDFSSPMGVLQFWTELLGAGKKKPSGKDAVAVVYVEGPIMPGRAEPSPFGGDVGAYSTTIRRALDKAADEKSVKAVVLRVSSPGGSAVASEIILNATKRVKAKKPFIVSMGDVAGSGGYYVACGSDLIYADASTITASIGVLGGKFATTDMWNKIGIHWDANQRGANAGILSSDRVFSEVERKKMQDWMNDVYGVFKGHVVAARGNRLKKPIDELAGGRVFTGKQALELGLVDKIGTLEDAIQNVAQQAKLKDYDVRVIPEPTNFFEALFEDLSDTDRDDNRIEASLARPRLPRSASILDLAMPFLKGLDPARMESVKNALRGLDMTQRERVILMTPEIGFRN